MNGDRVYQELADALDRLPNAFPRTPSGAELRLLRALFTPDEAWLATHLRGQMEPVEAIAARAGLPVGEAQARLKRMARAGLAWGDVADGRRRFRLPPLVVGIYESAVERMDGELAALFEEYWTGGGGAGVMKYQPALHRVVPAHDSVAPEWVLPYDDVRALLLANSTFHAANCICRVERGVLDKACGAPVKNCLSFSAAPRRAVPGDVSREEALAILDRAERASLVHTVSNVAEGVWYVCYCCGCCCGVLRGITELGIQGSVARASYYAVIDADECQGCGTCVKRCQVGAICEQDGVSVVDRARCIGCGLCVTGCPHQVARLQRLPDAEIVPPPLDFAHWERERLANRGLPG